METMGSYLRHRPEGRSSENLESRFTESPTSPGHKHLQGPQWPQPGPYFWPCCCSAATPSALWVATCLTPTAWPTGGAWCSCDNWGGSPLPPACRTEMTLHSPRRCWVAASCRRLKPSLCSTRWPSTPSSFSAQRARPPCGMRASWTSSALHWISSSLTCKPVWGRRRSCKELPCSRRTPAWLWGNTSTDSLSICKRRDTALVPGRLSEHKSWEPSLPQQTCRRVSGERTDTHLGQHGNDSHGPTDHTSSCAAMWKIHFCCHQALNWINLLNDFRYIKRHHDLLYRHYSVPDTQANPSTYLSIWIFIYLI